MKNLLTVGFVLLMTFRVFAELRTEVIEYKHGETLLEGYLAYDDAIKEKRPGVLVVHEWWGHNKYIRKRAEQLAELGYIAFALDMYGKGKIAKDGKEAGAFASIYRNDRELMRARANAGLEVIKNHDLTDINKIAAIGYCFGGTTVLELARSGALLSGVVSFHGSLDAPDYFKKEIKSKVLVLHGGDDLNVKPEHMSGFQEEMRKSNVDWQVYIYGGAVHSFTNPDSGNDPSKGVAYNEKADMCRSLINIDWQGILYNCDFNQAAGLPIRDNSGEIMGIENMDDFINNAKEIITAEHCYCCTAGEGSSCAGVLTV